MNTKKNSEINIKDILVMKQRKTKQRLTTICIIIFLLCIGNTAAQPVEHWAARYSGHANSDNDRSNDMHVDGAGNVYVTGCTDSLTNNMDYTTIKYNTNGALLWIAKYNGPNNSQDVAHSIFVDALGNVYVTGESMQATLSNRDIATIKYNSAGVQQWVMRLNGVANGEDIGNKIIVDALGNVYVTGQSSGSGSGSDYICVKYNSAGTEMWVKRFNGPANNQDISHGLALSPLGNAIYITGESPGAGTNFDFWTIKLRTETGDSLWAKRYGTSANRQDKAFDIAVDNAGFIVVTGFSDSVSTRSNDYMTIKYDTNGAVVWQRRINGNPASFNNADNAYSIFIDQQNNVYITGESVSSTPTIDFLTVKMNSAGDTLWTARYNGPANDEDRGRDITVDQAGNVYVTGESMTLLPSNFDYAVVKYNSAGIQQFALKYNGPSSTGDFPQAVRVDLSGNIYVTGSSTGNFLDMATVKYGLPTGITPVSSEIPVGFMLSQNYPNPFNPTTGIEFAIPKASYVKLKIYDMLGKEVESIVDGEIKAGTYKVEWNASRYPSGVYFYKMITNEMTETKKMMLIK